MIDPNKTRDELYTKLNRAGLCLLNIANVLHQHNFKCPGKDELDYITKLPWRIEDELCCVDICMDMAVDLSNEVRGLVEAPFDPDYIDPIKELDIST